MVVLVEACVQLEVSRVGIFRPHRLLRAESVDSPATQATLTSAARVPI